MIYSNDAADSIKEIKTKTNVIFNLRKNVYVGREESLMYILVYRKPDINDLLKSLTKRFSYIQFSFSPSS